MTPSFDDIQRNYDNASPPDDEAEQCDDCRRTFDPDDMTEDGDVTLCPRCWDQRDKCGRCGGLEHGECRDYDDLGVDE